jgi:hypothetical protein
MLTHGERRKRGRGAHGDGQHGLERGWPRLGRTKASTAMFLHRPASCNERKHLGGREWVFPFASAGGLL